MTKHPIMGFGLLQNAEVFENKGLARIKNRTLARSTITPTALPIAEVYDDYGNTYTLTGQTGSGVCYKNGVSIQSSLGVLGDLAIYKNYLWIRHGTALSCYGPLDNSPQWFGNIQTGYASGYAGALLVGQDDFLYSTNGNYIAKIEITASGTPAVAPTLGGITSMTALDLKDGQYASSLEEFGTKIAIGVHGGSYADRARYSTARLYTWNRQLGTLGNPGLADLPVIFNENGINAIIQHANNLYISAGTQGNIYLSDGTNYRKIATLPYTRSGVNYDSTVFPNAMSISPQGNLIIGLSGNLSSVVKTGIYEIDLNSGEYGVSYRTTTSTNTGTFNIGFINSKTYQELNIGWSNNAVFGVDTTDFVLYSSYGAVIETPLIRVGNYNQKKTFEHISFNLADPLVSGQNIRISYRKNSTEDYTLINTWGFSTLGSVISFEDIAGITDCEFIQLKIELDQATNTLYGSNINLIDVILR